ncbi:unnamed protein product [Schistosoma margrebowiei]|uniref:Uncharacterized protein n=1 Tax=Schistosoma margrebowiei TaxID=48269 RepID=A0A183LGX2_9TREM|nr:unnamed protein product [Schistosoma margrebowiei]
MLRLSLGGFNYPGINWSTGSCHSCNDEFSATNNMHCWSQWVRIQTRGDSILNLIFSRDVIPLSVKVYDEFEGSDHKIVVCALPIYPSYNRPNKKLVNIETISMLTGTFRIY